MSGSAATSCASNPGGRRKLARSSAGERYGVVATYGGSAFKEPAAQTRARSVRQDRRIGGSGGAIGGSGLGHCKAYGRSVEVTRHRKKPGNWAAITGIIFPRPVS